MKLQQYRFKFLTISKNFAVLILCVGFIFSIINVIDFNKARRIEAMNGPEFREHIEQFNYQRASLRALQAIAKKALDVSPQELEASRQANREIIKLKNNCLDCQNRTVFFDLTDNDQLTQTGIDALHASYELSPYGDADLMKWRLEVSSKFWTNLDEDLQKLSLTQITALSQFQGGRYWLRSFETDIESIRQRVERLTN